MKQYYALNHAWIRCDKTAVNIGTFIH